MTVEQALKVWTEKMEYYSRWLKDSPDSYRVILDQAYGFTQGIESAVDGLYEAISGGKRDLWTEWYMQNHPAYQK